MPKKSKASNTQKGRARHPKTRKGSIGRWTALLFDHLWIVTIVLFIISFVVRLALSFWSGPVVSQIAYPDEIRFFHIARSLAEHGQILVRGVPAAFQKILYSIFITPAFLFTDNQLSQANIIRVINCLLISSTVFPVVLLARKLTAVDFDETKSGAVQDGSSRKSFHKTIVLIMLLITVTLPDMAYSAAILSEVLYMPLCVWLFYLTACAFAEQRQSKRLVLFGGLGLTIYLIYLTKEIGAAFLIAAVLVLVFDGVRTPAIDQNRISEFDGTRRRAHPVQNILSGLVMSATFFAVFLAMKLTVFQGMGNTYAVSNINVNDQITPSVLSSPGVFAYLVYSAIILFVAAVLSFYAAPLFFSLYGFSSMKEENKKLYVFTVASLIIMVGAIAYTISIRENLGDLVPRLHMRYITPLVIPVLILCLDFLFSKSANQPGQPNKLNQSGQPDIPGQPGNVFSMFFPVLLAVFCALSILLIPHGPEAGYILDNYTLKSLTPAESLTVSVGSVPVNMLFLLFKLLIVTLTVYGAFLIIKKKKKQPVVALLLCVVFMVNLYDNFMCYTIIRRAKTSDFSMAFLEPSASHIELAFCEEGKAFAYDTVDDLIAINNFLKAVDGKAIVFVPFDFSAYVDTYLDSKAFPVQAEELYRLAVAGGGSVRMDDQPIWEGNRYNSGILGLDTWKCGVFSAEYIITLADDHPFENVKIEYRKGMFAVLRNLDPTVIHIELQ